MKLTISLQTSLFAALALTLAACGGVTGIEFVIFFVIIQFKLNVQLIQFIIKLFLKRRAA